MLCHKEQARSLESGFCYFSCFFLWHKIGGVATQFTIQYLYRIVFFRKVTRRAPSTVTPAILSSVDPSSGKGSSNSPRQFLDSRKISKGLQLAVNFWHFFLLKFTKEVLAPHLKGEWSKNHPKSPQKASHYSDKPLRLNTPIEWVFRGNVKNVFKCC